MNCWQIACSDFQEFLTFQWNFMLVKLRRVFPFSQDILSPLVRCWNIYILRCQVYYVPVQDMATWHYRLSLHCLIRKKHLWFVVTYSILHYSRGITPKHETSGEAHLHDLARGQHRCKEMLQRWRAVGNTVFDLTSSRIEAQTSCTNSDICNSCANWRVVV